MADNSTPVETSDSKSPMCPLLRETLNRKKVELDAQALTNRINLLEHEESKVLAKIGLTREKACNLMDIKQFKRGHKATLDDYIMGCNNTIEQKHEEVKEMKNHMEEAVSEQRKEYFDQTTETANLVKEQLCSLKERYQTEKRALLMSNMQSVKNIRGFQEEVIKEREDQLNKITMASRSRYEQQIQDEVDRRNALTDKMSKLETKEQELIKKLKNTQNIHAMALEDINRIHQNQEPISVLSEVHMSHTATRKVNGHSRSDVSPRTHDRTGLMTRTGPGANAYKR